MAVEHGRHRFSVSLQAACMQSYCRNSYGSPCRALLPWLLAAPLRPSPHARPTLFMLVVLGLRAVGVHRTTDDALEWSPPEVEESALERQQPGTHDHESGLRYNYVQAERKVGGASGAHGLPAEFADLFGVGGGDAIEVQVAGTSAMKEIIEKLFSQSGQVPPSAAMGVRGQAPAPGASTGVGGGLRPPPVAPPAGQTRRKPGRRAPRDQEIAPRARAAARRRRWP